MREFIFDNFEHVLCFLILVGRLGDILSTYMVTPMLKLEANMLAKKLGWPFCWLTVLICFAPYYSISLGILVLVPSLMVSASNISKIWFARSVGEDQYVEMLLKAAKSGKLSTALLGTLLCSFFTGLTGFLLWYLSPDPEFDWGYWFGIGIMLYAFIILFHGSIFFCKLFKKARYTEKDQ